MKRNYITPQSISLKFFTEDALMNTSTVLSDETNDDDAIQWSQKQNNANDGGLWQYMDE
uniref:hypothetical protein n=1 Tax=Alloprevotella sp. TaxID=1872471 RepID=UPI003FF0A9DF